MYELGRVRSFAAVALLVFSTVLAAQQTPLSKVTIQVYDPTGARVLGARIRVDPTSDKSHAPLKADGSGEASVDLSPGKHLLKVWSPGFETLTETIEVRAGSGQIVMTRLRIAVEDGPPIWQPDIWPESMVLNEEIPYRPLESLVLVGKKCKPRIHFLSIH